MMVEIRGFNKLQQKLSKWVPHRNTKSQSHQLLNTSSYTRNSKAFSLSEKPDSSYVGSGRVSFEGEQEINRAPKGHLPVYVGEKDDGACRVLAPVVYFSRPLFVGLLRQTEKIYGFDHPGRIRIRCRISEFENVQRKIVASNGGGKWKFP